MPGRPGNISGIQDLLHVLNQSIREMQIRIDTVNKNIPLHKIYKATSTLNFGPIPANQAISRNVRIAGVTQKGSASASPQLDLGNPHLVWSSLISSNGVVSVRVLNPTSSPVTPNVVSWNISVTQ